LGTKFEIDIGSSLCHKVWSTFLTHQIAFDLGAPLGGDYGLTDVVPLVKARRRREDASHWEGNKE
jgi:hypothetical protein